jgi:hypothetical protein
VIPGCAVKLLATLRVKVVGFRKLRYLLSQFYDAVFDRILHEDYLSENQSCMLFGLSQKDSAGIRNSPGTAIRRPEEASVELPGSLWEV